MEHSIFNHSTFVSINSRILELRPSAKRQWGKMNLVQMMRHLTIATGSGIRVYKLHDESSYLSRTFLKFLVLRLLRRLPHNAPAPKSFRTETKILLDFSAEKANVLNILELAYSSTQGIYLHPMFGKMNRNEWGTLVYRHFDHHLRQFGA
ncbi:DUF1569 domain-containing protein [Flavihumibacter solisilvae]|uniref:DUF1569 domain-containing protein n=1 Tax=Flavihumibacter solisilvae TaxID=1349421 RepID=A0A0C1IY52_9BACT|nr:DUF1569 domain-containing protein [Flavihumibacter solisilvae]KIC95429.1 hypothetical protein OI18_05925 [Flavihumibacter solisilvae]